MEVPSGLYKLPPNMGVLNEMKVFLLAFLPKQQNGREPMA